MREAEFDFPAQLKIQGIGQALMHLFGEGVAAPPLLARKILSGGVSPGREIAMQWARAAPPS